MSNKKVVITIARQIGSGGAYVAQRLAKKLNFKYIDREILVFLSYKLGADLDYLKSRDEKKSSIFDNIFRSFAVGSPGVSYVPPDLSLLDDKKIFEAQSDILRKIADRGNVVIVGRAAFRVLKDYENLISIFIHANREFRIKRIIDVYKVKNEDDAVKLIDKVDEQRRVYTKDVTGFDWFDLKNYKMTFDSSFLGLMAIEEIVYECAMRKLS
jgi:cytidylate kinase